MSGIDSPKNVISFADAKRKKQSQDDLAKGRQPLYVSHLNGKLHGSPHLNSPKAEDFGDRMSRIKQSLEKINRLMVELKKVAKSESENTISILKKN